MTIAQAKAPLKRKLPAPRKVSFTPTVTVYLALLALLVVGSILVGLKGGVLLDQGGILNILTRSTVLGLVAIGQTMVIVTGSLDLSVAYLIGLCSLVAAETMAGSESMMIPGVLLALGVAAAVGLVNGLVITVLKANAFIATLGVALILRGYLEDNYTGPAGSVPRVFQHLGFDRVGPVPIASMLMVLIAAAAWWYLRRTRTGYHMYAVGGDIDVARLSGVRTGKTIVLAHVLCAVAAGLAGVFLASRLGSGAPYVGTDAGYDLESIAAVVLGGAALAGGRGGVVGTLGGVLILSTLDTVFDDLAVDPFFKDVVRGIVLILAVALYARRRLSGRSA
ncbi:ribose transport system permease protein [Actinokineospora alba]|uniref:Ribose transport system permease protein n=1 Tax=Actinokineospora alba TaxID=504798 RepID=A0A1H0NNR3_9PSEU|nr:ABC transporter permease [Actinokineospora alba]TDP68778.1 ribose transport system permease protein [Actinokineospora alba]SDH86501.1 ribose transport system permease protein [Actinokineospora alba]SDO94045.1 ribose transport system permease protein [Actinokineospora alba]